MNRLIHWRARAAQCVSDGTDAGTYMVKDIYSGTNSSSPYGLCNANGTLFFWATDATNGRELWKSDGTVAGTILVSAKMTAGGTVVFTAADTITINGAIDPVSVTMDDNNDILINAPVTADNFIILRAGNDGSGNVQVTATGSLTGNVFRWYPGWLDRGL